MSAFVENSKISVKIIGVIGLLALIVIGAIGFAAFNMMSISASYNDQITRVDVAIVGSLRTNRLAADYGHTAYELAMETSDEGNRRITADLEAKRAQLNEQVRLVREALPEYGDRLDMIKNLVDRAMSACAGPIKDAGETTEPAQIVKAGARLSKECDPPLALVLTEGKALNAMLQEQAKQRAFSLHDGVKRIILTTIGSTALGLVLAVAAALWIAVKGITGPITRLLAVMERHSRDNLEAAVPGLGRGDEVGAMAAAVEVFRQNGLEKRRIEAEIVQTTAARARRQEEIDQLVGLFGRGLEGVFKSLSSVSAEMAETSSSLEKSANEAGSQADLVKSEVDVTAVTVQTVSAAAQQLAASIDEIGRQAESSSHLSSDAMTKTEVVVSAFNDLRVAADQIGTVVQLINNIAGQTNLLALNATIEAARAGDAGKGFAVVAGEVKILANQTAKATGDIGAQITAIQAATARTAEAIESIAESVRSVHGVGAAIASAVTEQSAATQEIARSVEQVSNSTAAVTTNIKRVNDAIQSNRDDAIKVSHTSSSLSGEAQTLSGEVRDFLAALKNLGNDQSLSSLRVNRVATITQEGRTIEGRVSGLSIGSAVFVGALATGAGTKLELRIEGIERVLSARYVEASAEGHYLQLPLDHDSLTYMGTALKRLAA